MEKSARNTKLNLIDYQIFDVHLTTLLTYLGAFTILLYCARKRNFHPTKTYLATFSIMIPAVLSFEIIWIPLNSLMTHTRFYGISSMGINLAIIAFSLLIALGTWGHFILDFISASLIIATIILWLLWLPTFAIDSASRLHADPIKVFQTAAMVYPFVRK